MTNYIEQEIKQSKIQEYADLLGQISRALEKKNAGIEISEYEEQLLSNDYSAWMRIQTMLRDAEIAEDIWEDFLKFPKHYKVVNGEIIYNENWEEEAEAEERERIAHLSLTKREVFLAIYKDKGITPEQIRSMITNPEGLIEFDFASSYFRGNPLIGMLGEALGYTPTQLDILFETGEIPEDINK